MTLDNTNLITYGMNNSHYRYYQSIVSEQQQQEKQHQQHKLQNKSAYQASTKYVLILAHLPSF